MVEKHRETEVTEADLIARYGEEEVQFGKFSMPLSQAVALEADMCDPTKARQRQDPVARVNFLVAKLGQAGVLAPEHQHLWQRSPDGAAQG